MNVRELIDGCCGNDPTAWAALWEIVSSAALYPIRRLLQRQGLGLELADDVMQEFYLYIRQEDLKQLRSFRGQAMPQFRAFIRTLAVHFALNAMRKLKRIRRQEDEAARFATPPDRSGPTANQIRSTMQELTALMPNDDRLKVLQILDDKSLADELRSEVGCNTGPRSRRTERRWREELFRKYARRVT
jgi:DNA-directed RNA polymerase specialized sigma24 family protein